MIHALLQQEMLAICAISSSTSMDLSDTMNWWLTMLNKKRVDDFVYLRFPAVVMIIKADSLSPDDTSILSYFT